MSYSFPCDWKAGFVMDPVKKQRVGYLTDFTGLGAKALAKDISVFTPYNNAAALVYTKLGTISDTHQVTVTGIIENISWGGGVGDPISISFYASPENALTLRTLKQMTLKTTTINAIGFETLNYDEKTSKTWFEEFYPMAPPLPTGQLNAVSKTDIRLHIADEQVRVAQNIDVWVYNVYLEMVPAADQTATFNLTSEPAKSVVLPWGLKVGAVNLPTAPT
jgi:hypothetical protein